MKSARLIVLAFATVAADTVTVQDLIEDQPGAGAQVQQIPTPTSSPFAPPVQTAVETGVAAEPAGAAPTMPNLLQDIVTAEQGQASSSAGVQPFGTPTTNSIGGKPLNGVLSQDSMAVVSGLLSAFLHKMQLASGEQSCLERNMAQLTGDIMGTVGDVVTAVAALIQGKGTIEQQQTGGVVSAGIDSAMKITSLVALSTQLVKDCVHGDALDLLKETAHHLVNGTYLQHRFIVNGVDIAHSLSDSVVAFESKDFHKFGWDIGFALRKILLSNADHSAHEFHLPEGLPEERVIQQCTAGLMDGFFVQGSEADITDASNPAINIRIDLHECIAENSAFFKEIWAAAWNLIESLSANAEQHQLNIQNIGQAFQGKNGQQPKWAGELMVAMMQFPMAISRCGVNQGMQDEFMQALKSLQDVRISVKLPDAHFRGENDQSKAEETTARMAKAVEAFTNFNFDKFGYEIGKMLRELVMLAFPSQYAAAPVPAAAAAGAVGAPATFGAPAAVGAPAGVATWAPTTTAWTPGATAAPAYPTAAPAFDEFGNEQRKYSQIEAIKLKRTDVVPEATAIIGGAAVSMLIIKFALVVVRLRGSAPAQANPSATSDVEGGEPALE